MKVNSADKFRENIKWFSENLRDYMYTSGLRAKELALKLNVAESTINDYLNEKRLPNTQVLLELLKIFPEIQMSDWLTKKIPFYSKENDKLVSNDNSELKKYFGSYLFFYFQTDKVDDTVSVMKQTSVLIKCGALLILNKENEISSNEADAIAVLGLDRETANKIKVETSYLHSKAEFNHYISEKYSAYTRKVYAGSLTLSQESIFITLRQLIEKKDFAHMVLSRYYFNSDSYIGGVGTINSTSTGSPSLPVIQLVAIAREDGFRIDENSIYNTLVFKESPIYHSINQAYPECKELLDFSRQIFENTSNIEYQRILFQSKLDYLLLRYMQDHKLCYTKITKEVAKDWYKILKNAKWGIMDYEE